MFEASQAEGKSATHQAAVGLLGLTDRAALVIRNDQLEAFLAVNPSTSNQSAVRLLGLTNRAARTVSIERLIAFRAYGIWTKH